MIDIEHLEDGSLSPESQKILTTYFETVFSDVPIAIKNLDNWKIDDNCIKYYAEAGDATFTITATLDGSSVTGMSYTINKRGQETSEGPYTASMLQELEIKAANTEIINEPISRGPNSEFKALINSIFGDDIMDDTDEDLTIDHLSPDDHLNNLWYFKDAFHNHMYLIIEDCARNLMTAFNTDKLYVDNDNEVDYIFFNDEELTAHLKDSPCPHKFYFTLSPEHQTKIIMQLLEQAAYQ